MAPARREPAMGPVDHPDDSVRGDPNRNVRAEGPVLDSGLDDVDDGVLEAAVERDQLLVLAGSVELAGVLLDKDEEVRIGGVGGHQLLYDALELPARRSPPVAY